MMEQILNSFSDKIDERIDIYFENNTYFNDQFLCKCFNSKNKKYRDIF